MLCNIDHLFHMTSEFDIKNFLRPTSVKQQPLRWLAPIGDITDIAPRVSYNTTRHYPRILIAFHLRKSQHTHFCYLVAVNHGAWISKVG